MEFRQLSPGLWISARQESSSYSGTLDVGMGPITPTTSWMTVWVRRDAPAIADRPIQVRRNRGLAFPPSIADSGPQIPYRGRQQASGSYSYPHPCWEKQKCPPLRARGGHPSHAKECDLSGSPRALLLLLSALSLSG